MGSFVGGDVLISIIFILQKNDLCHLVQHLQRYFEQFAWVG